VPRHQRPGDRAGLAGPGLGHGRHRRHRDQREQTAYLPGKRAWIKVCSHTTAEGLIGGVTGALASPATLLLGRYDALGHLRLIARTTLLSTAVRHTLAPRLHQADADHPWQGRHFGVGWGTRGELDYHPVRLDLVAEFRADTAVDEGRYRHPVRFLRLREDLTPGDVPPFDN
jgi:hypothetical protein